MRYDEKIIEEVQAAGNIVEVIGQFIPLKRSGQNFKARCPFHQEKTASFMVHPGKQIFHCFGCGAGGDIFSFLMRYENLSFPEAVRQLAERAHIRLAETSAQKTEGPSENEQLYEIYRLAARYYHERFLDPEEGKRARDYFRSRDFKDEMIPEFQIGWAPEAWQGLFGFLSQKGFREPVLLRSGLIHRSPKGNLYDVFRGRLLFPIHNLAGKVVAFGGRLIAEGDGPKYLNSPENPVFHKRRELFGLTLAKKSIDRDRPQILVVEGYLDFLRLYQEGFKAAVATLGTSLTEDHVKVLKRFAQEAVVIYDGDRAGEAASLRGLEVFLEGGMNVKLVRMPAGFDPDDFVKKKGARAFQDMLAGAKDFFDYELEVLRERFDPRDALGLMRITDEFLETLAKVQNPILLDRTLRRLAAALGVEENSLRRELAKLKKRTGGEREKGILPLPVHVEKKPAGRDEILLLALAIDEPSFLRRLLAELEISDFQDPSSRRLFQSLSEKTQEKKTGWSAVLNRLDDRAFQEGLIAASNLEWPSAGDKEKAFLDCLRNIKRKRIEKRLEELRRSIAQAEQEGDQGRVGTFIREYQDLLHQEK